MSEQADVTIINYDIARFWVEPLGKLDAKTVILDECQNLANRKTKADHRRQCHSQRSPACVGTKRDASIEPTGGTVPNATNSPPQDLFILLVVCPKILQPAVDPLGLAIQRGVESGPVERGTKQARLDPPAQG